MNKLHLLSEQTLQDVNMDLHRQYAGQLIGEADLETMTSRESVILSINH